MVHPLYSMCMIFKIWQIITITWGLLSYLYLSSKHTHTLSHTVKTHLVWKVRKQQQHPQNGAYLSATSVHPSPQAWLEQSEPGVPRAGQALPQLRATIPISARAPRFLRSPTLQSCKSRFLARAALPVAPQVLPDGVSFPVSPLGGERLEFSQMRGLTRNHLVRAAFRGTESPAKR